MVIRASSGNSSAARSSFRRSRHPSNPVPTPRDAGLPALDGDLSEHFCSPAELGWAYTVNLDGHDFHGRAALAREADADGPARTLTGLMWDSSDMAELYAALFHDAPSAPPPDLPCGQCRMSYLKVFAGDEHVGWASGVTYSPNLRRMISLARLRKDLAVPGTELSVMWGGFSDEPVMKVRARVHKLPFISQHRTDDLT
jgi:glycine cleavage system aminomethyltransferase T